MVKTPEAKQVTSAASSLLYPEIDFGVASNATYTRVTVSIVTAQYPILQRVLLQMAGSRPNADSGLLRAVGDGPNPRRIAPIGDAPYLSAVGPPAILPPDVAQSYHWPAIGSAIPDSHAVVKATDADALGRICCHLGVLVGEVDH